MAKGATKVAVAHMQFTVSMHTSTSEENYEQKAIIRCEQYALLVYGGNVCAKALNKDILNVFTERC